jgi:hypothetical protein
MSETTYRNRRACRIENDQVRVTVLREGGHIAEILHKPTGVNPLWTPPWPSIEPSTWGPVKHPEYGDDAESKLLAGIMGHNLCLDLFGAPSPEEAKAGITVHGEASIAPYTISTNGQELVESCDLEHAGLHFERKIALQGNVLLVSETVVNLSPLDRPIAWTQHATLGPPFVERGSTQFRAPGTKSYSLDTGAEFLWPMAPRKGGSEEDLQIYTSAQVSGGFTTHLMDPGRESAFFFAFSPHSNVLFGYVWKRSDFPWLGIWEENHSRTHRPWNGEALTKGMEFGTSPFPESRRKMIERNAMFGAPCYRWVPAKTPLHVDYYAFITTAKSIPSDPEELDVAIPALPDSSTP